MTYDKDKFEALRSLEVPFKIALALADDESPLNLALAGNVPALADPATATSEDVANKVNDLISALVTAGLMAEEE